MKHGGDVYTEGLLKGRELLDFSSNINPLGVPESFKKNISEALDNMERYPDVKYRELKKYLKDYVEFSKNYFKLYNKQTVENIKIGSYNSIPLEKGGISHNKEIIGDHINSDIVHKVVKFGNLSINEDDIVLGNGAAEIIDLVISCFNKICIPVPSFIEYEQNALKWGCYIEYSFLKEDMTYDYEDIALKIKELDALFIANPNNPNGMVIDKDKFKFILDYCEENNKVIIVDEAFIEFTGKSGFSFLDCLENYSCLFIIKALTKFYAMPGIRMGYGVSKNKALVEKIKDKQNPWNVNCFAETAVKYVLKDEKYIYNSIKWIDEERDFMTSELKKITFIEKVYKTYSNFVLCKLKGIDCNKLYELCLEKKIVIRKCDNFKGLDEKYVRLAIKDRKSNEQLLEVLSLLRFL